VTAALTRWWPVLLLGLATIGAYGTVYYSIGVLIPVIGEATGWSTSALAAGFSFGLLGTGGLALLAGRVFDRAGSRPVMLVATVVGATLLLLASFAQESWQFTLAWSLGASVIGGGLYYNVTMPATARLYPDNRVAAFSVLTLLGALASPIFYPLTALLTDALDWRGALQALVGVTVACVLPAALFVHAPRASSDARDASSQTLVEALYDPAVWRALLMFALVGAANSAVLLHQVAIMEAAGLTLAAASGFAGARGFCQIGGRLVLVPLTSRFGLRGTIGVCYALAGTATLALLVALLGPTSYVLLAYFAVVSGMSLGLLSPINGLFQAEVYGDARLGTLSGITGVVTSASAAGGAALAGVVIDVAGSYQPVLLGAAVIQLLGLGALLWQRSAGMSRSSTRQPVAVPGDARP
jgi:predicted MFS family arabinose efflux permease